jgi:hypothetical protein
VSCAVYETGQDVRVALTNATSKECGDLATSLSSGGDFWTLNAQQANGDLAMICVMSQDGVDAEVIDSGSAYLGRSLCSSFIQHGWIEDRAAEASIESQLSAAASAAASASQVAADADTAQRLINSLSSDTSSLSGDVSSLATDAQTTDTDLATTRSDAKAGNGDQCTNASTTVYNDAATTVYNDVLTTIANDATSTANEANSVRNDISNLNNAIQTLRGESQPSPAGASQAITAGQTAVSDAISTANADIDRANADLANAYRVANSVGTGDCAGDGPGSAPAPVAHIG